MSMVVLDSGVGGLVILKRLMQEHPQCNYIYFMDNQYFPYGEKSRSALQDRLQKCVANLYNKYSIKNVILACNTATISSIDRLRVQFPQLQFFGVIPVIKPGFLVSKTKKIACLATQSFLESQSYIDFADQLSRKHNGILYNLVLPQAVQLIEQNSNNLDGILNCLQHPIESVLKRGVDTLILGCTHYTFVRELIQQINKNIFIKDSTEAFTRHIIPILQTSSPSMTEQEEFATLRILSSDKQSHESKHRIESFLEMDFRKCVHSILTL